MNLLKIVSELIQKIIIKIQGIKNDSIQIGLRHGYLALFKEIQALHGWQSSKTGAVDILLTCPLQDTTAQSSTRITFFLYLKFSQYVLQYFCVLCCVCCLFLTDGYGVYL